jgi:hypothetical protein
MLGTEKVEGLGYNGGKKQRNRDEELKIGVGELAI